MSEPAAHQATPRRAPPLAAQLALGFLGPGVLAFVLWLVTLALTHGMHGWLGRGLVDLAAVLVTLALWVALFRLSGRPGWRGVRIGLFLLVAAILLWIAGCFALARSFLH